MSRSLYHIGNDDRISVIGGQAPISPASQKQANFQWYHIAAGVITGLFALSFLRDIRRR